jgi:hypothetical protein
MDEGAPHHQGRRQLVGLAASGGLLFYLLIILGVALVAGLFVVFRLLNLA